MADSGDLKHMVMSFRVSELQVLLGFAGRNKTGRKQELLSRALNLVQKGCSMPVQIKIKDLYKKINEQLFLSARRRFPTGKPPGASEIPGQPQSPPPELSPNKPTEPIPKIPLEPAQTRKESHLHGNHPSHNPREKEISSMPLPAESPAHIGVDYGDISSMGYKAPMLASQRTPNTVPVHPDVRLKVLPFYDLQGELLKPSSLVPRGAVRFQENYFVFHLTPQQAQDIAMSRDIRPGAKCEYLVQIQLRFCLLETSCEQDDNFPPSICVRVNGKMAALPNPIPSSKPGVEPRRPSRPVDITPLCRLSPTSSNHVDVSWASEFGRGYCVAIYLVKKLSSDILFSRLKQNGTRHPDHSRALIKEKLSHDPDSEIATTSLRVSLCCPLGKMKMQNPCRASTCSHLQCFDASTFLMMNEKKPTWTCPVCDKPATFDKLILDGLFVEILQKAVDCKEIQFLEDCTWKPMKNTKDTHIIASSIIDAPGPSSSPVPTTPKKKPAPEVIDLTSDTSDDDDDDDDDDSPVETSPPPKLTREGCVSSSVSPVVIKLERITPPPVSNDSPSPFTVNETPVLISEHSLTQSPFPVSFTVNQATRFSSQHSPTLFSHSNPMISHSPMFMSHSLPNLTKRVPQISHHNSQLRSSRSPVIPRSASSVSGYSSPCKLPASALQPVMSCPSPLFSQPVTPAPTLSSRRSLQYNSPVSHTSFSRKCQLDSPPPAHSLCKSPRSSPTLFKSAHRHSPYPTGSFANAALYPPFGLPGLTPLTQQYYQDVYKMLQISQASATQMYSPQTYLTSPLNLSKRSLERDSDDPMAS